MEDWISKKDLLAETGISYGQLYRWKREGLIPESWFVKRAVPSGQETYLPREMILNRIAFILKYKDRHPLSELNQMLSPDSESRHYKTTALIRLPGMLRPIMQISALTNARDFNHGQALCALIGSNILTACDMTDEQLRFLMKSILTWQQDKHIFSSSDGRIAILDPSYRSGKFDEEGRAGKVEIRHGVIALCEVQVLVDDTATRDPGFYLFWRA